jgi:hypothetical protein
VSFGWPGGWQIMKAWMSSVSTTVSDHGGAPFRRRISSSLARSLPVSRSGTGVVIVASSLGGDAVERASGLSRHDMASLG